MALGNPQKELLADWKDEEFSTAPPEGIQAATDEDLKALFNADPWPLIEEDFDDVVGATPLSAAGTTSGYRDEGRTKLYVGKEFTRSQFEEWLSVQWLGSLPATGIGVHRFFSVSTTTALPLSTLRKRSSARRIPAFFRRWFSVGVTASRCVGLTHEGS